MAQEQPSIESLFDFFYLDKRKISSFYAQLTGNGSIESYKETHSILDEKAMEATVGVPTVTGGKLGSKESSNSGGERYYNAVDTMPREMINRLDELGFINRDLSDSNLGQLVLIKGRLGIIDVNMLSAIVEPALNYYISEMKASSNKEDREGIKSISKHKADLINFIKNMPFAIQSRFLVGDKDEFKQVWMTLNRDELSIPTHDINFKHGEIMAGEWYLLGVLDALPGDGFEHDESSSSDIQGVIREFVNQLRNFAGRPSTSYGITPVAIFRNIKTSLGQ